MKYGDAQQPEEAQELMVERAPRVGGDPLLHRAPLALIAALKETKPPLQPRELKHLAMLLSVVRSPRVPKYPAGWRSDRQLSPADREHPGSHGS